MCLSSTCSSLKVKKCENNSSSEEYYAKKFVQNLVTKGSQVICDETESSFNNDDIPSFYDPEMFKKGQEFFSRNIFGICFASFLGLMADLSIPSGLAVLSMTKKSGSNYAAYKRYVATILHMFAWYKSDFEPGSNLWQSIKNVKQKHNSASKKAASALKFRISQKDMALAHWGFMGIIVCRPELVGIYEKNNESWRCFIHFWRVIGHLLGITEEFNICKESVNETRAICHELTLKIMLPTSAKRETAYMEMCQYLVNGLRPFNPFLEFNSFMFYMDATLRNNKSQISDKDPDYRTLKWDERLRLQILLTLVNLMKFPIVRIFMDYFQLSTLWLSKNFPLLAYWSYGKNNVYVQLFHH